MAPLVQPDRRQPGRLPGRKRPRAGARVAERAAVRAAEGERVGLPARPQLVRNQLVAQDGGDRYPPPPGLGLRLDELVFLGVVGALHPDQAACEVNVLPAKRHQLAPVRTGVHGRRPEGAVLLGERCEQARLLLGRGDPIPPAADGR